MFISSSLYLKMNLYLTFNVLQRQLNNIRFQQVLTLTIVVSKNHPNRSLFKCPLRCGFPLGGHFFFFFGIIFHYIEKNNFINN